MNEPLDTVALLKPISVKRKAGIALSETEIFTAIEKEKVSDPEGVVNAKKADWKKARKLAEDALKGKGKDLYVACSLVESLYHTEGLEGVAEGLRFVTQLLKTYWKELHPEAEAEEAAQAAEGNEEASGPPASEKLERLARLEWLDRTLSKNVQIMPLTLPTSGRSGGLDSLDWERAVYIKHLRQTDKGAADTAMKDSKISPELFDEAIKATPPKVYLSLKPALDGCFGALEELDAATAELMNGASSFGKFKQVLTDCNVAVEAIMLAKGMAVGPEPVPGTGAGPDGGPGPGPRQPMGSREEALRELVRIATFFRDTEPHSPVSYLILRAEKWARMPLDKLLGELIGDGGALDSLKALLNLPRESVETE